MSGEEKAENIQRELFRNLSGDITDEELNKIKQELKQKALGGFKAGEIQRELKTTDDILEKLKRRGLIKIGDYGMLRKLFEAIGSHQLLDYIDEAENSLKAMHWPVKGPDPGTSRRDPMPGPGMGCDPRIMYHQPQFPQGPMMNPPPYQHSSPYQHSYGDGPMAAPPLSAPHAPSRQQYTYQQGSMGPPQMAPSNPPHPTHYFRTEGQSGAPQRRTQYADMQRASSLSSQSQDDVFLPQRNIPFDNRTEYEPGRGYVLFINNFFTGKSDHRKGAEVDESNVRNLFKNILPDYFLQYQKDVITRELQDYLKALKETLSTGRYQSFIFILATHGQPKRDGNDGTSKDAVLMADGNWMLVEDIVSNFYGDEIPAMKDKPKVFIIQSCRGKELQRSVSLSDSPAVVSNPETQNYPPTSLATRPVNSDVLIAYATSEGKRAWRNEDEGSWFVKDLCDVISQYYDKEHILDILVRVNGLMVWREATVDRAKQMPCFICTFTRRFMLALPSTQ